jgi:hypothetical protein
MAVWTAVKRAAQPAPYISTDSGVTIFTVSDWVFWNPSASRQPQRQRRGRDGEPAALGRPGPFYWFMNDY